MNFETFLLEAAKGYTPRHDEHNEAVSIVKKHTAGVEHSAGDNRTELVHHSAVHGSKHQALHKALVAGGYAHRAHQDSSSYRKGNTTVRVDSTPDVAAKLDGKERDHHQVSVSTSHSRAPTQKAHGPTKARPPIYD